MDLPQQVLDAAIVELVTPVTVLIQLTHLAHEEVRYLGRKREHDATFVTDFHAKDYEHNMIFVQPEINKGNL